MTVERAPAPWVLSGRSAAGLRDYAQRLAHAAGDADASDVAWTLATERTAFAHRAVILGDDRPAALRDLADGTPSPHVIQGVLDPDLRPDRPVFVFSGQGGQWQGMAVELLDTSPVFAEHMRACGAALSPHVDWVLEDVLRGTPGAPALVPVNVVPPVLVAVMISLAALWRSRGVEPAAVVGHSHGEIAAAHVAGVLSLDDAVRVAAVRARTLTPLSGKGGMAAVSLSAEALERRIAGFGERLVLAAVNGPTDVVVSGEPDALDELLAGCEADGVRARRVAVDYAAHGPQIEAIREQLLDELGEVTPQPAQVPLYSTTADEPMDAAYWYRGERQTVQFAPAVERLLADGHRTFIEVGPHPVLTVPIEHVAEVVLGGAGQVVTVATLRRGQGGPERFATALAELWTRGGSVDWAREIPEGAQVDLPASAETGPADDDTFASRILAMGDAEARRAVLNGVTGQVAVQLGHGAANDIDAGLTFKELGLDSPGMVELRNRVNDWTGLRLPATVVFDNPTPAALADRVLAEIRNPAHPGADGEWSPRAVRMEEPIAIVGMACRYPGGVASPDELWDLVSSGGNPIGDFPTDRGWDLERLIDRDGERPDASYVDQGYFLYDAGEFDPELFGISPREALAMDPQQRLMLECSWEALEHAGIDPLSLRGSSTGVFTGMMSALYGPLMHQPDEKSVGYALTGTETSVASGRVAYVLGLEGPAVSIDTACSASLVALHLACQALRSGECDLALAGGATVMSQPGIFIEISRQRGLAPDARCKAFGAGANGTGWSEGAGVIALEPLSAAIEHGHEVLAVIRGSAVNQDGASNGLSAPNGRSQERVIRTALASAGLEPADVDAVEAHGTGTALGDPIEATALLNTYGQHRDEPLRLGSLKSNLGHSQAAAGVGGVIKMVQALRHAQLPKTLWADEPTPHVDWDSGAVELLTEPIDWPVDDRPRRAGVSSFGISGTNAHVILEQAPEPEPERAAKVPSRVLPFLVSASSEAGLAGQAERLAQFVAAHPELDPAEVAASLALRRAQLPHRAVAVAGDLTELSEHLSAFARGEFVEAITQGVARGERRAAFVFPGQGGQWEGMAVELLDSSSVFAERMRACEAALAPYVDWSLEAVLRGEDGAPSIDLIEVVQPVLFAIMVSLAEVWRTFGIEPAAVVGHSQGEIAAAHIIGALSLEDAARIVAVRSQALATIAGVGGMLAVALSREQFEQRTADLDGRITIAAVNGPRSMVVSGEPEILEQFAATLEDDGVQVRRILSTVPGHSPYVEAVREQMLEGLEGIQPQPSTIPLFSTVTAERIATETMDAEHWYRNLRQTVQFQPAVQELVGEGIDALIEIGPHPVLTTHVQDTIETAGHDPEAITLISSLRRDDGGLERMIASFADAQVAGLAIDWTALFGATPPHVPLPTYAFQRERYWNAPPIGAGSDPAAIGQASAHHPLLDAAITLPGGGALYTGRLGLERHPWLADHAAAGAALLPGAAFLDLALHAAAQTDTPRIEDLTLHAPLLLDDTRATALQVTVAPADADGTRALTIHSQTGDALWTHHVTATLTAPQPRTLTIPEPPADAETLSDDGLYDRFADAGYEYGPAFQRLTSVRRARDEVYVEAALAEDQEQQAAGFALHPSLFDAVLQAAVLRDLDAGSGDAMPIPFAFTGVQLHAPHATAARATLTARGGETEILVVDGDGAPVLSVDAFQMRPLDRRALRAGGPAGPDELYEVRWEELTPSGGAELRVVGIGTDDPLAQEAHESLEALEAAIAGGADAPDVVLVPAGEIGGDAIAAVHALTQRTLELLQSWLASEPLAAARLVVVTRGATGERPDLAQSALLGLLRSAHTEHPDRFTLLDLDGSEPPAATLLDAFGADEPVLAVRQGTLRAPRLARATADPATVPRVDDPSWHLALAGDDGVAFTPRPDAGRALEPGEVRIAVRATGLNFKDVVVSMGLVPDTTIGLEGSGVVLETGEDVTDLAPGDRVMGLIRDAYGPEAIVDRRLIVTVPESWSFEQAASVPVVFLTAWYSLVDLAGLQPGESVLLHGAAGGVGMAARQVAAHLGADVFATAHPNKWETVAALGVDPSHIANSRTTEFREAFLETTGGRGVDVVLGSLAGEIVDASLDLLPRGGRFVEMGKTDVRDPEQVAAERPGVRYQPVDLITDPGPERTGEMLAEIVALFEQGALHHLPIATRDVRDAASAFAYLQEGRHTGKVVLRVPRALDPEGTVLITGGTGGLGAMLARHLAEQGARRLLLVSRRGPAAEGADELVAALAELGAEATVAACDVSDRAQLAALLADVPALTAVVHTAGVLDDGVISSLDAEQLHRVLAPKVDAAIHLDELTREHDLAEFILYSSVAATLGLPGQANYAAANAVLDGLAQRRRAEGLPGSAMAFGVWETATGMSGHLAGDDGVLQGPAGLVPIPDEDGLELIDEARALSRPLLLPTLFDRPGLRAQARAGVLAPILRGLFSTPSRSAAAGGTAFAAKLAAAPERDREALALDLVREHLAAVLGHSSTAQIDAQRTFKEAGIDSLSAVELRNRISRAAGQRLPATLVFDYPTPAAVATLLSGMVEGAAPKAAPARRAQTTTDEPMAIVGMACRYPGGIASPDDLWDVVVSGRDAIGEFPDDRGWGVERLFDPDPDHIGTTYVRRGGFLRDAAGFDADHFGISPREALATDPQQRVFLECAWEALENAGIDPLSLRGSSTGVFAGVFDSDYGRGSDAPDLEGFRLLGGLASATPGRVSYHLGLEGPAVSVDTACSSSLVAIHLAAQALRSGECDLVLTGGVTVLATTESFVEMSRQRGLSPDGRCRAFGAGADGTGFSDGAGILVMERLSVARERGHQVLAVVRSSAINQDGASNGFAAPSGPSQERVIRAALANGGLQPSDVDAVEAHGTGTTLGDPMEANALLATYGQDRTAGPLKLGSLKSNIGHSQAAAGVGGIIKMVQALQHELLPRTLYAEEPSPHISWDEGAVELLTEPVPWEAGERTRRAGVSSFGMSGTNAHIVIEEAPAGETMPVAPEIPSRVLPYVISASSDAALAAQATRLAEFLADHDDLDAAAVAATLALHRAQLPHRAVAVAGGLDELADRLSAFARGEFVETVATGLARGERRAAFVFPGQGGQWEGMAVELLDSSPVFAERMRACQDALAPHVDWDLEDVLRGRDGAPSIDLIEVVQPVLFAIMVSLAALWRSYGIEPSAVVGHSQGEIAAAHIIGALTLEDAARIVAVRSQALATIAGVGGMLAVALSVEQLQERAADLGDRITIAAVNGPRSLVISGDPELLDTFAAGCEADGVRVRRILSTVPGHSPPVEAVRELMLEGLEGVAPMPSSIPLYSTVTGERIATETMDAEHWYRNLRQTVLFQPAAGALIADGIDALIEIGPHPVLAAPLQEILESTPDIAAITTLRRDDGGLERFIASVADAHVAGLRVDWTALFGSAPPRAPLPTYAFQHRRFWLEAGSGTQDAEALGVLPAEHPLLRATTPLPGGGALWTGRLSLAEHAWLTDHAVLGDVVVPAALFLDAVLHAAIETDTPVIDELTVTAPLVLEEGKPVALQVTVLPADAQGRHQVTVSSRPERPDDGDAELTDHAVGTLIADADPVPPAPAPWPADGEDLDPASAYARLSEAGYELGPVFHGLSRAVRDGDALHAEAGLGDETDEAHRYDLHPALLASGLQAAALTSDPRAPGMPFAFSGVRLHQRGAASLRLELAPAEHGWSVVASDADGAAVVSIDAVRTQPVDDGRPARRSLRNALYAIDWSAAPQTDVNGSGPRIAVLGDGPELPGERHDDLAALVAAVEGGAEAPEQVLLAIPAAEGELPEAAHALTARVLAILQAWLEADALAASRLVVLTRGAVAGAGGRPDLHQAPLAGLVRTAGSEHPGRFALVDTDDEAPSAALLLAALASDEPEVAIRDGALLVPRVRPFRAEEAEAPAPEHPTGTILITGGATGLGAMLAHHLAERQGARHLLLVSRRGAETPGAAELVADLRAVGCEAEVAACDVADRVALERLLATIPPERPLTAVFHSAAALDDGVLTAMDDERLRRVMRPKMDAALHLHELTRDLELSEFVLFSSAACCLGNPGQANYAAANAFLDALAAIRRADGLPGLALAFGFWGRVTDLTQHLTSADGRRVGPLDLLPMSDELGLDLIDAARGTDEPLLAPMRFDLAKLAGRAQSGILPPILSSLVRARPRRAAARTLAPAAGNGSKGAGVGADAIRREIAAALGYESADAVDMQLTFLELGFDSLVTLELRKRLQALTGLALPTTVLFDHPTPAALVAHLVGELGGTAEPEPAAGTANGNGAHGGGGVLDALFRRACRLHRIRDAIAIAEAHARLRPRFGVSHHRRQAPTAVPLAQGPAEPIVACIPSLIASSGPHEYARFAKAFAGRREVIAVPVPGFLPDELLPSRIDAAAGAQAVTIAEHAQGRPVALVGFSTGGLLAHAVAVELERIGAPAASVALIDTYTVDTMLPIADLVFDRMLDGDGAHPAVDDDRLGTMGVYLGLLAAWTPPPRAAPTLLVKATEPVPGLVRVGDWTASWPQRDAVANLPGTHLTIFEDHAETTARAVEDWVARHPAAVAPSARHRLRLRVR